MDQAEVELLKAMMEWEGHRTAPPQGFPHLPDLPAARYTSPEYYALEQKHIFRKSWLFAAHLDEVPEPGCFMKWDNAGEPLIIVHGHDGVVRAFYNTCRHRGAPVLTADTGKVPRLVCSYHHWTYKTDGTLAGIPEARDFAGFDPACRSLVAVRCEMFGNCIFINLDDDAMPLRQWFGPIADEWEEFAFDRLRLAARHSFDLDCNWKIAMEANLEVYHVPFIHPETVTPLVDPKRNFNSFYPHGHSRMLAPPPRDERVHVRAIENPSALGRIDTVGELGRSCTQSYALFPNWVSPLSNYFVPPLIFWPTSLTTTRLELITMAPDWGGDAAPDLWTQPDASQPNGRAMRSIILEDTQLGEAIQRSMASSGFRSVPLCYQEARIYYFHQECDRMIGIGRVPEKLRVKPVLDTQWVWPNDPRRQMASAA